MPARPVADDRRPRVPRSPPAARARGTSSAPTATAAASSRHERPAAASSLGFPRRCASNWTRQAADGAPSSIADGRGGTKAQAVDRSSVTRPSARVSPNDAEAALDALRSTSPPRPGRPRHGRALPHGARPARGGNRDRSVTTPCTSARERLSASAITGTAPRARGQALPAPRAGSRAAVPAWCRAAALRSCVLVSIALPVVAGAPASSHSMRSDRRATACRIQSVVPMDLSARSDDALVAIRIGLWRSRGRRLLSHTRRRQGRSGETGSRSTRHEADAVFQHAGSVQRHARGRRTSGRVIVEEVLGHDAWRAPSGARSRTG